jgi:hypothetical protein
MEARVLCVVLSGYVHSLRGVNAMPEDFYCTSKDSPTFPSQNRPVGIVHER